MLLEHIYYIKYILALYCAFIGHQQGVYLPMWLVLIRKKEKVNKRTIVLCLNPIYIKASGAFPASVYKRVTRNVQCMLSIY